MTDALSAADVMALTRGDDDRDMWNNPFVYLVWIWAFSAFGGGFGGLGNNPATQGALTRAELYDGFTMNNLERQVQGVQNGLCDGFYAMNTSMLQGQNALQSQICQGLNGVNNNIAENRYASQQCCCETNRNIDAVRAENYRNTCEITNAIHAEGEATRALINSNTMQDLRDRLTAKDQELQTANFHLSQQTQNATLINALRPFPQPAYITCSPYTSSNGFCACGC